MTETQIDFLLEQIRELSASYKVINHELGDLCGRVSVLESQVADLKWMSQLLIGLLVTVVVGALLNLVIQYKSYQDNKR